MYRLGGVTSQLNTRQGSENLRCQYLLFSTVRILCLILFAAVGVSCYNILWLKLDAALSQMTCR